MNLELRLIEPAVEEAIAEAQAPCEGGIVLRRKPIPISNELRGSIDEREAVVNLHHVSVDHHPLSYRWKPPTACGQAFAVGIGATVEVTEACGILCSIGNALIRACCDNLCSLGFSIPIVHSDKSVCDERVTSGNVGRRP